MAPQDMDGALSATALEVQRLADQAQAELMRLVAVTDTLLTVQRARGIQQQFNAAFVQLLAARLTDATAASVWDVRTVRNMRVGDVSLSQRLYTNATQTAQHVAAMVREHAKGNMQARDLALRLYDGYSPRDGLQRPLEGAARAKLPAALRALTADPRERASLQQVFELGQRYAQSLKTEPLKAAYLQALKAWERDKGAAALERALDIAFKERTRYMANRIAQTELARAYQHAVAAEVMADDAIAVVQVQMSAAHPVFDVCDMHSKADLWGLGPGCYPKEKAPVPPFHPHCRCKIRTRPSLTAAMARETPGGEAAYLRTLPMNDAVAVAGSRTRLQRLLNGGRFDDVVNEGRDAMYRLQRMGGFPKAPPSVQVASTAPVVPVAPPVVLRPPQWFSGSSADAPEFKRRGAEKLRELLQRTMPSDRALVPIISQRGAVLNDLLNDTANLPDVAFVLRHFINQDLKASRAVGGETIATMAKSGKGNAIMRKVAEVCPDDWIHTGNSKPIAVTVSDVRGKYVQGWGANHAKIRTDDSSTAVHEYAHHLQARIPELDKVFQDEHKSRTVAEDIRQLSGLPKGEMGREDGYYSAYQGREYEGYGANGALEVMTMALQPVLGNDKTASDLFREMFAQDLDMLRLTIGVLFHFKP